jgi:hypothetical protein
MWCGGRGQLSSIFSLQPREGTMARDNNVEIIFSACHQLLHCKNPSVAELLAVLEGVSLALHWCNLSLDIEVDCLEIVKVLNQEEMDRSAYSSLIEELKTLLKVRQTCITHVRRGQNFSSQFLANYAREKAHTAVWFNSGPEVLAMLCDPDCNS